MAAYGYSYVSEQGFVAFQDAIDSGAWRDLEIKPFRVDEPIPKKGGLLSAPKNVTWKLSIAWALAELTQAIGTVTSDEMLKLDQAWDASQRRLSLQVSLGEESESPEERDAAGRVRAALLSGAGLSQTSLSWDKQVDYGRNQVRLATSQPLSSDVELLGLRAVLEDVKSKTNALAVGL
ncbi:MAG: hypothetical protein MUF54_10150, partial [Polyangiaceae bacterium]|nr:hypothetical protein [Polyangiaceae bacterium]